MRAVIYTRISRDPDGTELGVKRQTDDCQQLAAQLDIEVVESIVDDDRSAYSGKARPGYNKLRGIVGAGGVDVVLAWHPDRLTRHPRELEDLIDLLESTKTTVRTVQTGEYDLATASGRMAARIVGAVARHESEHKSARLRRKHVELAEAGKLAGGGDRPFGYDDDRVTINKAEALVVRDAAKRVLAGESIRSLCTEMNDRGLRTTAGMAWKPIALRRVLMSARTAGLRSHKGVVVGRAVWPAIISPEQHRRLVAVLNAPARRQNNGQPRKLLTGLLTCGKCGARMVSRPKVDKRPAYVCAKGPGFAGCGGTSSLAEPVEDLVVAAVLHRLDSPELSAALEHQDDTDGIDDELQQIADRLSELATMWASGELDRASWAAARQQLEARQTALTDKVRQRHTSTVIGAPGAISAVWDDLTTERRRAILAAVVEAVVLAPAVRGRNTFDPSRVSVRWAA